jgi:transposase-like protein
VRRVRIVLQAATTGASNTRIAELLGINRGQEVRTWRNRWLKAAPRLIAAEEEVKEKAGDDVDDDGSSNGVLMRRRGAFFGERRI